MKKIAIFVSHPAQYQTPFFQKLAAQPEIDLIVYFFWDYGVKETYDPKFGQKIKWDIPMLDGYKYEFLKNWSRRPTSAHFFGEVNPGLIKKMASVRYDAVIIFGWQTFSYYLAIFTAFLLGIPILIRGENPYNQEILKPPLKRFFKKILFGLIFKIIKIFLYIGEENKKFYQYYGATERKLSFFPNAVDNERFQKESQKFNTEKERAKIRKELGIDLQKVIILFAGKLIPLKRPLDLLKAYQKISEKAAVLFMGDGPLRGELENYVKRNNLKNVRFLGFINQTEIGRYYSVADIFVLLSDRETWGLPVSEAMNFAKPVVVSEIVGCASDLVKPGVNGFIFPVGDTDKLAERLECLINNPSRRREFGENSFKMVSGYNYDAAVKKVVEILNKIGV